MTTSLTVDLDDSTPPYEQIRRGIVTRVASGSLLAGDRLPAIRALAADLGVAVNTVARAYRELEEAGIVTTRRGAGTRISEGFDTADLPTGSGLDPAVETYAAEVVATARDRGLPLAQLVVAVRDAIER
ncbi:GntR family transcriptional regulator [Brevibacterium jeotgali]|uniref:DNA-binding transcriptional regulator YhcF, GntR family n=1 Tax=Brevibacterium jeotgali TaxID=1262550 RepID=A0A2H1L7F0_9MICO|nr:GntR family transcriptional regulator [Brevibacterium jeotgali]TWB98877.1 GntR family transcriptional regulator [Brevibacterium jeotgali]SMY12293.1 DNA-binding transcriptional regulator YhcF, GntR family [Brevibacterium jeotgali]